MPEAPRQRPAKHRVLHTFAAHIAAAPAAVFDALDARLRSRAGVSYYADSQSLVIVAQGAWWYRAEYRVESDGTGSHLEHLVITVAQRGESVALAAGRKTIAEAPLAFHELVKGLRAELE